MNRFGMDAPELNVRVGFLVRGIESIAWMDSGDVSSSRYVFLIKHALPYTSTPAGVLPWRSPWQEDSYVMDARDGLERAASSIFVFIINPNPLYYEHTYNNPIQTPQTLYVMRTGQTDTICHFCTRNHTSRLPRLLNVLKSTRRQCCL